MASSSLYLLSADVVCDKLIPKYECSVAALLPNCIKATILHKLTKRGTLPSVDLFRCLLSDYTTVLDLSQISSADDRFLYAIAKSELNHLKKIDINALKGVRNCVTNEAIEALANSRSSCQLEVIFLRRCVLLCDDSISKLLRSSCHFLKSLCLAGCPNVTDQTIATLAEACHLLEGLDVSATCITDSGLELMATSPINRSLTELKVSKCVDISASGVRAVIGACQYLRIFCFDGCPKIGEEMATLLGERENWQWHRIGSPTFDGNQQPIVTHQGLKQVSWTIY